MTNEANEEYPSGVVDICVEPSDIEGFTYDIFIGGYHRFSVNENALTARGIVEIVSESMQIGAQMQLQQMGKLINDVSDEEH